jgi:hypothetical protein
VRNIRRGALCLRALSQTLTCIFRLCMTEHVDIASWFREFCKLAVLFNCKWVAQRRYSDTTATPHYNHVPMRRTRAVISLPACASYLYTVSKNGFCFQRLLTHDYKSISSCEGLKCFLRMCSAAHGKTEDHPLFNLIKMHWGAAVAHGCTVAAEMPQGMRAGCHEWLYFFSPP